MHWFWRATIAIVGGYIFAILWAAFVVDPSQTLLSEFEQALMIASVFCFPPLSIAFLIYGLYTRYLGPSEQTDNETRCRKCQYILKGISEPRCPECGERI